MFVSSCRFDVVSGPVLWDDFSVEGFHCLGFSGVCVGYYWSDICN